MLILQYKRIAKMAFVLMSLSVCRLSAGTGLFNDEVKFVVNSETFDPAMARSLLASRLNRLDSGSGHYRINIAKNSIMIKLYDVDVDSLDLVIKALSVESGYGLRLYCDMVPLDHVGFRDRNDALTFFGGQLPVASELLPQTSYHCLADPIEPTNIMKWHVVSANTVFNNSNITTSHYFKDPSSGFYSIHFGLNESGSDQLEQITTMASARLLPIACIFNNRIISIINCNVPLLAKYTKGVNLTGELSRSDAQLISAMINVTPFPWKLQFVSSRPMAKGE